MTDILLIYPPYSYPKKSPPIGLAYLAAVLEKKDYAVRILDLSALAMDCEDLEAQVRQMKPRLVGISFMTNQYKDAIDVSRVVKDMDKQVPVIVGGPHVSALPKEILAEPSVDVAVVGEGETTVLELAEHFLGGGAGSSRLSDIAGVAYKHGNEIHLNRPRELIQDLDALPFPAWQMLPLDRYAVPATGGDVAKPVFAVLSSRGCPNNCIFCDSHTIFGRRFRPRSAQNLFDELVYLNRTFDATQFDFVDDTLTVNKDRVYELCDLILDNHCEFQWMCNARVNTVTDEMLRLMKEAGCVRVEFGVESGSPEVLRTMKKGIKLEQIKTAHAMARRAGLSIGSFVMVGNLGEDFSAVVQTRDFLRELDTDDIYIAIATPFPGTELYKIAKSNDWIQVHDWSAYVTSPTYYPDYRPIMKTDGMNPEEILEAFFYLHAQFVTKKFRARYGKYFLLKGRFYKDVFRVRSFKELRHKMSLAVRIMRKRRR